MLNPLMAPEQIRANGNVQQKSSFTSDAEFSIHEWHVYQCCHYRMIRRSWRLCAWENNSLVAVPCLNCLMLTPATSIRAIIRWIALHWFPCYCCSPVCACYWVDGWASTGCVLCVDASAHHQHVPSPRCCCPVRTSLAYAAYLCQMKPSTALATYSRYTSACYQPGNASMPEVTG